MKVKHDVAKTGQSCLCSSSKRYLNDKRFDKEYYGKCISLREIILLKKLFGAVYDDITQMLPGSNTKRKSSDSLRLTEETMKAAKSRLIGHALKIVNIDKPADSKILSNCCSCCREVSGCRVETAKRVGKRQVKRIWSDICTYKFNDWKEKEWAEMKRIPYRNIVTLFDYPFNYKKNNNNKTPTFKNYTKERQRLIDEMTNKNLTTFKISTPFSQAYRIETGKIPFENIENGINESINIHNHSPLLTYSPPYNFMANPIISLNKINNCESNLKHRFDKDATGDSTYETVRNIQPIIKRNNEKNDTNRIRLALRRYFCTLTLKPYHSKLDLIKASEKVAKSLRHIIRTTSRSQSKSVSERSKIIKKTNKKNIVKVRYRSRKNFNIVKEKTYNSIPKFSVKGNNDHSENNLNSGHNILEKELIKNKLNRNVFCVENTPRMSMNLERQSFRSKKSTSPVAEFKFDAVNDALEMKKLSGECNLSYISHYSLDCKPEIDKFGSLCQNVIDKKPQVPYECQSIFNGCIPHECLESTNKIHEWDPNEHQRSACKKFGTHRSEPKSTINITQKHIELVETANVQTSFKSPINLISINSKQNQAVQVNSCFGFDMEFYEKKSPLLHDAHICQCGRQYRDAGFQTIETRRGDEEPRGNHSKKSETYLSYKKNVSSESDAQSCFCTSKLHKMGGNIVGPSFRELRYSRKGIVSKEVDLKSFHQNNYIMRQNLGCFTDISCERPLPCTSNKENMSTNFIIQSKRILQRTTSNRIFSYPLKNKSRQSKIRSYRGSGSEIMNNKFSRNQKIRHTYVSNGKPYPTHDHSNKYRHDYSPIELLRERAVECKTSLSSFSSTIEATTTTTSVSNHSYPSDKYKKYEQNTSHGANSIYKSNFYVLDVNVNNTRTDTKTNELERKKTITEASHSVTSGTDPNAQESVKPVLVGRRGQAVRIGSNFDVEFPTTTVPGRDFISGRKEDRGAAPVPDFVSERKHDSAASMPTHSNKSVNQGTHVDQKRDHALSKSHADRQHVGINTHPKISFFTLKLHKMGRVYREKGVAESLYRPKPNVLQDTVTTKENSQNAAVVELDREPGTCIPGECDPQECLKIIKKRSQKNDVSSKQACRNTSNFSFSIEFVKYIPEEEKPKGFIKRFFHQLKLCNKWRTFIQKLISGKKKHFDIQNQNPNPSVQSHVKYQPDDVSVKEIKTIGQYSKINSRLADLDPYECEPETCIPGDCDPNECFEIIKKRGMGTTTGTHVKPKRTQERTPTTYENKDKKHTKIKEDYKNSKNRYRLEDLDPYECEPGTCIPGECDPNVCFEIIRKRGMGTCIGSDVKPKHTNKGTTNTHKKKDMKRKAVKTKSIQGTMTLRDYDSQIIPEHSTSKRGAILERCFCTAKLLGIEIPAALAPPLLKSMKVKQKASKNNTKKVEGHSRNSQTIKPARKFSLLYLEPCECEPGVCVPGECDPDFCYEGMKRKMINISTLSNHDSRYRSAVMMGKNRAAMSETEKRQDGDHAAINLSSSVVRSGSSFEFNVEFSRQISGMGGDGPYNTKPSTKRKVFGTEVPANPKTKAKGSGHLQRDSQVVRQKKKTANQASESIGLRRCFCTLSLKGKSKSHR